MTFEPGFILDVARSAGREIVTRGAPQGEVLIRCPWAEVHTHGDASPSCRLNPEKNTFFCDPCGHGGGVKDLAAALGVDHDQFPRGPRAVPSSTRSTASKKKKVAWRFVPNGPISPELQRHFAVMLAKNYTADTWTAFGVRHGQVQLEGASGPTEDAIAFPLPSGGQHVYHYQRQSRKRRWRFADGGKADLLTVGLDRDDPLILTEGEWDAMRAFELGYAVATGTGGAGTFRPEWASRIEGREIVIVYDVDRAGVDGAEKALDALRSAGRSVATVRLPLSGDVEGDGKDLCDFVAVNDASAFHELIQDALAQVKPTLTLVPEPKNGGQDLDQESGPSGSQADRIVELVLDGGVELFHDPHGEAWTRVDLGGHREIWRGRSRQFRQFLAGNYWKAEQKAPRGESITSALNVIEAKARFESDECALHNRVARHEDAIWYDLADAQWRAVAVRPQGWTLVDLPPRLFRRYAHQRPQVLPASEGDLHDLLRFVNLKVRSQQLLLLVTIVASLVPDIPHIVLVLHGPQGSAKTSLFRMIRRLVDPSITETLTLASDKNELVQQLDHHWCPLIDNLTTLPEWISDTLCRAVTGEGFSKRELYSDDEDVIYSFRRCVGLNGINIAAQKPDLLDRCLLLGLEPIPADRRRAERELWGEFERMQPRLFGAALDALSQAMAIVPTVTLTELPRMADFTIWGCAIAEALGHEQAEFLEAFEENFLARNEEVLASNPIASMVIELMKDREAWGGAPSDLLAELSALAERKQISTRAKGWPKAAHILTRRLNEVRPNLNAVGIDVQTGGSRGKGRWVTVSRGAESSVGSVGSVEVHESEGLTTDAPTDATDATDATVTGNSVASARILSPGEDSDATDATDATFLPSD